MVPQAGRRLIVRIMVGLRREEGPGLHPIAREPGFGVPVAVRQHACAMKMRDGAGTRLIHVGSMNRLVVRVLEQVLHR